MMRTERAGLWRATTWLVIAIAWLGFHASAHADGAILFVGKIAPHEREVIRATIADTAHQLGWRFAERSFAAKDTEDILACLKLDRPRACVERLLKANDVDQLAVVQVGSERGADGTPQLVVTQQVVTPGADVVFINRRICEHCDAAGLRHHVSAMTTKLLQDASSGTSKTMLSIKATPAGALITLDGDPAGAADATLPTYPGKHTVMLRAAGYETTVRDVTATEGKTTELAVTLRAAGSADPAPRPRGGGARRVPWIVIGAGAAALITGGVMIGLDEDEHLVGKQAPRYRDTAPVGVAVATVGTVAIGVGVYLLLRTPSRGSRPRLALGPAGAVIGWAGEF